LITFLFSERSLSQTIPPSDYNTWAAGLKFGTLPFYGDVRQMKYSPDDPYRKTNTGIAFEGIKDFNQTFGAKLQLLIGSLSGSSPNIGLHFNSNIEELSVIGVVNLNDLISYYPRKDKIINTYMFAGFGMLGYRAVVRTYNENNFVAAYGWDSTGAKTTLQSTAVFPFGIGIKLKVNPKIDVGFELTLHLTNTNKLDAWSYKNSYNDRYSFVAVSLTYKIGKKKEYVEWVNPYKDTSRTNVVLTQQNNNNSSLTNKAADTARTDRTISTTANSTSQTTAKKFFIIAGSFSSKQEASKIVTAFKANGYPDAEVVEKNDTGLWLVCYKGYTSSEDANHDLLNIKKVDHSAWIFEKK